MATAPRGDYATLNEDDMKHFAGILAPTSIISSLPPFNHPQSDLDTYNNDWMGKYHGRSKLVLKPKTTAEVSEIMKHCYSRKLAVVPQGGNTGLVGSGVPANDEVIISLANMSNVRSFDPMTGIIVADAGCILENLSNYLAPHSHIIPLDLGAKGRQVAFARCGLYPLKLVRFQLSYRWQCRYQRWRSSCPSLWLVAWLGPGTRGRPP
ncbi:hypothetical protein FS749_015641 [Ceratobasidium sp. UAMH 11750]|nr:hypothetical protein FS749_015641 [Ceratobasidium sp. UAMH 11750]